MELSRFEIAFVKKYMSHGYKAWSAYHQLRPNVTKLSAYTLGARILRKESVRKYISDLIEEEYRSEKF